MASGGKNKSHCSNLSPSISDGWGAIVVLQNNTIRAVLISLWTQTRVSHQSKTIKHGEKVSNTTARSRFTRPTSAYLSRAFIGGRFQGRRNIAKKSCRKKKPIVCINCCICISALVAIRWRRQFARADCISCCDISSSQIWILHSTWINGDTIGYIGTPVNTGWNGRRLLQCVAT